MVKQKKILCICVIVALMAALCAASAFADDVSASSSDWYDLYFWGGGRVNGSSVRSDGEITLNSQTFDSLPTPEYSSTVNNATDSFKIYLSLHCSENEYDPEHIQTSTPFRSGYTYKGRVYFSIRITTTGTSHTPKGYLPFFTIGVSSGTQIFTESNSYQNVYLFDKSFYLNDSVNDLEMLHTQYWSSLDAYLVSSTSDGAVYSYTVDFSFHCDYVENDFFVDWESFDSLGLFFYYDHDYINEDVAVNAGISASWSEVSCQYDPNGSLVEPPPDDTEQIVDGQIAAAQFALDQEQSSNQQASSDAAGQGSTAASTVFSGSNSVLQNLRSLLGMLTSTHTTFTISFPASGNVPYLGQLWTSQAIPIKQWIDALPIAIRVAIRFLVIFGAVSVLISVFRRLIILFRGDDK